MELQRIIILLFNLTAFLSILMVALSGVFIFLSLKSKDSAYFWFAIIALILYYVAEYAALLISSSFGL